ncbi:MAG: hydroxyisourate hydrolase [Pseudomonadota bacterium]
MAGFLTTHVLDTARGRPAANLEIDLYRLDGERRTKLRTLTTNADGRTDGPILPEDVFETGSYELIFHAGAYLEHIAPSADAPPFLDQIPIRFAMTEDDHYHVPLLLSPYGYSTYRGS